VGRLKVERSIATAAVRAVVQLAAVALVITAVLSQLAWSLAFAAFMFGVAVFTSSRRIEARGLGRGLPSRSGAALCPSSR
jgi:putative ABC transport system permease protein